MTAAITIPNDYLRSLHASIKNQGGAFKSAKQRGFLISRLAEYALNTRTLGEMTDDGFVADRREYTVADDAGRRWAFTCHKTEAALDPCLTRRKLVNAVVREIPVGTEPVRCDCGRPGHGPTKVVPGDCYASEPVVLGPVLDEAVRAELKAILRWGPSEFVFTAPSPDAILALIEYAKMSGGGLAITRSRKTTSAWGADDLGHITRVQIAAKGLLCEVSDHAGESVVSMTAADAEYISQMLTVGHLRNGCWFKRKAMAEKRLRSATIVNKAKMDDATAALAQRMVCLMNAEMKRLGRPVSFGEYCEIMTAEAA